MPDDGPRHELLDGVIVVSASPSSRHQGIVGNLLRALRANLPPDPPPAPPLAIEGALARTRRYDLPIKRDLLEEAGWLSYRVIDQGTHATSPSVLAWELVDGACEEVARISGDETWHATQPLAVDLTPNLLLDEWAHQPASSPLMSSRARSAAARPAA